jgi:DNA repair exonuclease SbcCD nuclease subunit
MSQRSFRFIHASDLQLDLPIAGVADAPESLAELLINAPTRAAERVFDTAIHVQVDFLVISGNAIDPAAGSLPELLFLAEQFGRLNEHHIPVYWCGGSLDSTNSWPSYVEWPKNVRRFAAGHLHSIRHDIGGATLCEIIGSGHSPAGAPRPFDFAPSARGELFSIAVASADWNCASFGEIGIDYWALGGRFDRSTSLESSCVAHFPGSPQGRKVGHVGPHGCTLVSVNEQRKVQLSPIPCDVARWHAPQLAVPETCDRAALERVLRDRSNQIAADAGGCASLVEWRISSEGPLRKSLCRGTIGSELTAILRNELGRRTPPIWTLGIEIDFPSQLPPHWLEEQTLRGDFIRAVLQRSASNKWQSDPTFHALGLGAHPLPPAVLAHEVSWLGAELLSPQEAAL